MLLYQKKPHEWGFFDRLNHRLSRWYAPRLQGEPTNRVSRRIEQSGSRVLFTGRRLSGLFLRLRILATRKRVNVLLERYLIYRNIFLQLIAYIGGNSFLVSTYCIDIITSTPEMPIPIFIFEVRMSIKYHK